MIALPEAGVSRQVTDRLPSSLSFTQWPQASNATALAEVVRRRLEGAPRSIEEDLTRILGKSEAEAVVPRFRERAALPSPANLRGVRLFPIQMPPSLDQGFKGRVDVLRQLHHELSTVATGDAPRIVAIEGGGGFGKTRLAREYFHRFGPTWYQGGLFWLDANVGAEGIEPRFHGILRAIKPETPDLKTFRDSNRNAREELAAALQQLPGEAGVLFVVDDVPEPAPGVPPKGLEEWCPGVGVVTVLSTSRTTTGSLSANVHPLNLDVLPVEAAVELLTYRNERAALDDRQWALIAEWVGRLPLALELLQHAMQARAILPLELFDLAKENRGTTDELNQLMDALRGAVPAGALRGITEAFDKSYNLLPENAREAARILACLAPEPIPLDVLKAMGDEPSSGAARSALVSRSFIIPPKTVPGVAQPFEIFGQMHKLLADFIRAKSPDRPADLRRAGRALIHVMAPVSCQIPAKWPLMNACLPHAEEVFDRRLKDGEKEDAELAVDVGLGMGVLHDAQGATENARKIEEQTLEFASRALGVEDHRTLTSMHNLAKALWTQGDLAAARKLLEQVLDISRRILGEEQPDTLSTMNNIAVLLRAQGDLVGARKLGKRVLDARISILGGEHEDTLNSMNNLALTLEDLGDLEGARKLQEQVLDGVMGILGAEHPYTLISMSNLAETLRAQGDLAGAHKLQEQVLDARTRILGSEHPDTTVSAWNLFLTLKDQSETERANTILEQNLKWLLNRDPGTLSYFQRQARESLESLLRKPQ